MNQIDPWRQQMQQLYAGGVLGGHDGHQAFAGPSTMQAYAMSGQGRFLNPQTPDPNQGQGGLSGGVLGSGGGSLADMIRRVIEYQQGQAGQQPGSGARLQLPRNPLPRNPGAGGLLGAY